MNEEYELGEPAWIDRVTDEAIRGVDGGLDISRAYETLKFYQEAALKQARALAMSDYPTSGIKPVQCPECQARFDIAVPQIATIAKAAGQTIKALDEYVRVAQFAQGKVDSRPAIGAAGILAGLTEEQLTQVETWLRENARVMDPQR